MLNLGDLVLGDLALDAEKPKHRIQPLGNIGDLFDGRNVNTRSLEPYTQTTAFPQAEQNSSRW